MVSSISAQLEIVAIENLGQYLGIPIITGRKGKVDFSFVVDKIRFKLSGWKATTLSQAGRISLAQSCICSVPTSICDEVERMCCDFIWGSISEARKNHLVS